MSFYSGLRETARRLITEYGKPISIVQRNSIFDPETGQAETVDTTQVAVAVEYPYDKREIDGTNVQTADRRFFVVSDSAIDPGDQILIGLTALRAVSVSPLEPGEISVMTEVQARK